MFIFGTNEFGYKDVYGERCNEKGCDCYCETQASSDGNCPTKDHDGYNLYKFVDWVFPGKQNEILIEDLIKFKI